MDTPDPQQLPLKKWNSDMRTAVDDIYRIGGRLLKTHIQASARAAEIASQWKLAERLEEERQALNDSFALLQRVLKSIDEVRTRMRTDSRYDSQLREPMIQCAELIRTSLPLFHKHYLVIRHCALDLLRWTRQYAEIESSDLPNEYRTSYAKLLSYAPIFRPALEAMQSELLWRNGTARMSVEMQELLTQLTHYMAAVESTRAFVSSVVSPPKDLVFQETHSFQEDWMLRTPEEKALLATELNDCCQLLLYDHAAFDEAVHHVEHSLSQDLDAALYVLPV